MTKLRWGGGGMHPQIEWPPQIRKEKEGKGETESERSKMDMGKTK